MLNLRKNTSGPFIIISPADPAFLDDLDDQERVLAIDKWSRSSGSPTDFGPLLQALKAGEKPILWRCRHLTGEEVALVLDAVDRTGAATGIRMAFRLGCVGSPSIQIEGKDWSPQLVGHPVTGTSMLSPADVAPLDAHPITRSMIFSVGAEILQRSQARGN